MEKFTQLWKILHKSRPWRSRQISILVRGVHKKFSEISKPGFCQTRQTGTVLSLVVVIRYLEHNLSSDNITVISIWMSWACEKYFPQYFRHSIVCSATIPHAHSHSIPQTAILSCCIIGNWSSVKTGDHDQRCCPTKTVSFLYFSQALPACACRLDLPFASSGLRSVFTFASLYICMIAWMPDITESGWRSDT